MLKFEDHNFRVNSDGWKKFIVSGKFLVNKTDGDNGGIWEVLFGEAKGEQRFTWKAMMRETKRAGKIVPTDEELDILLKTKKGMPNLVYAGRRLTAGAFEDLGFDAYFWSSSQSSSTNAWGRVLHLESGGVFRYAYPKTYGFSVRCLKQE